MMLKNKKRLGIFTAVISATFIAVTFLFITTDSAHAFHETCDSFEYISRNSELLIEGEGCAGNTTLRWAWNEESAEGEWDGDSQSGYVFEPHSSGDANPTSTIWTNPNSLEEAAVTTHGAPGEVERLSQDIGNSDGGEVFIANNDPGGGEQEDSGEGGAECEAKGVTGFTACDFMTTALGWMESTQTALAEILFETDRLVVDRTDTAEYQIWSNVRNIANALLAVAFMAIIFSLAFSVNVDAYTVKRIVPKLLVATVAIQASFLISALMVDVTNVLGQGLQGLTDVVLRDLVVDNNWGIEQEVGARAAGLVVLASLVGAVGGLFLAAPVVFPIIGLFFLVLLGAFLIIALREVFIFIFIALSPVFFLANLLPATEKWFKFWWSNFARLLFMYPFIILMIQMANIAALVTLTAETPPESAGAIDSLQELLAPLMAIAMQLAGVVSIYFAFRVGGSALTLATQGVGRMRKLGGGGGGGKGGSGSQGLTGKIKAGMKQRKNEYATGSRGNLLTQSMTSPRGTYSRSKLPGGKKTAAQNVGTFNAQVGENAKALETEGHDPKALKAFAEVGGSQHGLNSRIKELRSSGKEEEARSLAAMAHHGGNRSMQAAAAKQAASKGNVDDSTFEALKKSFGDDTVLSKHVRGDVARGAKDAGRPDLFAKHNAEGKKPEDVIRGMGAKDMAEMKADALGKVDDNGNWKRSEFGKALEQGAQPGNPEYETLKAALSPANGMAADRRAAIANTIGQDKYGPIMKQAESGQRSGGGESYVVDANTPNATGSNEVPANEPRPSGRGDDPGYTNPDDPNSTAS